MNRLQRTRKYKMDKYIVKYTSNFINKYVK